MRKIGIVVFAAALFSNPTLADANTEGLSKSAISGVTTKFNSEWALETPTAGLTGLTARLGAKRSCDVVGSARSFDGRDSDGLPVDFCNSRRKTDEISASLPGPDQFVTGLAICLSMKMSKVPARLAGFKLTGGTLAEIEAGNLGTAQAESSRTACVNWQEQVNCPAGEVAVGLQGHFKRSNLSDYDFVGLGLLCRKVGG